MRAFRLAYDGTGYRGFQRQTHSETVEDALLEALEALDVPSTDAGTPPGYAAAGRTDADVSAVAQTVAFETPAWLSPAALNSELPADVRAWASADVPDGLHATQDAARRAYEYHLHAPAADDDRSREALARLAGEHDFHNLTPDDQGTTRDLETDQERDETYLVLRFAAGGFPREFVRRAVSLVGAVVSGKRDLAFIDRVLSAESLDGPEGIAPAAPEPLILTDVSYPGVSFARDKDAAASAMAVFERRQVERQTGARVAERLRTGVEG